MTTTTIKLDVAAGTRPAGGDLICRDVDQVATGEPLLPAGGRILSAVKSRSKLWANRWRVEVDWYATTAEVQAEGDKTHALVWMVSGYRKGQTPTEFWAGARPTSPRTMAQTR